MQAHCKHKSAKVGMEVDTAGEEGIQRFGVGRTKQILNRQFLIMPQFRNTHKTQQPKNLGLDIAESSNNGVLRT